jgi:hypothetical protein
MNAKLRRSCVTLWALGILGMWVARALMTLEPRSFPFQVAAGLWILGGLGYAGLGIHVLTSPAESPAQSLRPVSARRSR